MDIYVCIGSACHLKGAYKVIESLQGLIKQKDLGKRVTVKAAFCLGQCTSAVSVRIDEGPIYSVSEESIETFFEEQVLRRVSSCD